MKHSSIMLPLTLCVGMLFYGLACEGPASSGAGDSTQFPGLHLQWTWRSNDSLLSSHRGELTLVNTGTDTLRSGWALHFSSEHAIDSVLTPGYGVEYFGGDYFALRPQRPDGLLAPGDRLKIRYRATGLWSRFSMAPRGAFLVGADGRVGDLPIRYTPLDNQQAIGADRRYRRNAAGGLPAVTGIVPTPQRFVEAGTTVRLAAHSTVSAPAEFANELTLLQAYWREWTGGELREVAPEEEPTIRLAVDPNLLERPAAYALEISANASIVILAGSGAGAFYAIQSLRALAPIAAFAEPRAVLDFPVAIVNDAPRFAYRGLLVDVSRHFHSKASLLRLLDLMGFYKLNRLHLHLSDDEGWRLEIAGLPELTAVGGRRAYGPDESGALHPSFGSGARPDGSGSGFYSQDDFIEILRYAADRHIRVIPEFDLPGHARAAIVAMEARYQRLNAAGDTAAAAAYRLRDPSDRSRYRSVQGYADNVVDVCRESTYRFFEKVVDETSRLYQEAGLPLVVLHIGGDEVPDGAWTAAAACTDLLADDPAAGPAEIRRELSTYFQSRVYDILLARGIRPAGWQEIALAPDHTAAYGRYVPDTTLADKQLLSYVWNTAGGRRDLAFRLANAGFAVVLCNAPHLYFDMAYEAHPAEIGQDWAGLIDTRQVFAFTPLVTSPPDTALTVLDVAARKRVTGLQGQLWSETVADDSALYYLLFPKLIALAERAWAPAPAWAGATATQNGSAQFTLAWNRFASQLGRRELPRLDHWAGGVPYRISPPGARYVNGQLWANVAFPGLNIHYTTDGSVPTPESAEYVAPVALPADATIQLRTFTTTGRGSRVVAPEL
jgi:hexosaminidase